MKPNALQAKIVKRIAARKLRQGISAAKLRAHIDEYLEGTDEAYRREFWREIAEKAAKS